MTQPAGRTIPLTPARRYTCDLLKDARRIPTASVQRTLQLPTAAVDPGPSWYAVFTKAYGFVAAARPELRRVYQEWPWPHFYEDAESFAAVAMERCLENENVVVFAHIRQPQNQGLQALDQALCHAKESPLETIGNFQRLLRRLGLQLSGRRRAQLLGTFGVTDSAGSGAPLLTLLAPLTTTITYGPVDTQGKVDVHLTFDQRILGGTTAARVLEDLQRVLSGDLPLAA